MRELVVRQQTDWWASHSRLIPPGRTDSQLAARQPQADSRRAGPLRSVEGLLNAGWLQQLKGSGKDRSRPEASISPPVARSPRCLSLWILAPVRQKRRTRPDTSVAGVTEECPTLPNCPGHRHSPKPSAAQPAWPPTGRWAATRIADLSGCASRLPFHQEHASTPDALSSCSSRFQADANSTGMECELRRIAGLS